MKRVVIFNKTYNMNEDIYVKSELLNAAFEESDDDTVYIDIDKKDYNSWEWIYSQMVNSKNGTIKYYNEDSGIILKSLRLINFFDIKEMKDNIFRMINEEFFTVIDLLIFYRDIETVDMLKIITHLFFIKKFLSIGNFVKYIIEFDFLVDKKGKLKKDFLYLDGITKDITKTLRKFKTDNIPKDIEFQKYFFGDLLKPFILIPRRTNLDIIDIPDFLNLKKEDLNVEKYEHLSSIMPQQYIDAFFEDNSVDIDINVKIVTLTKLSTFYDLKPKTYIYRFIDPFTGNNLLILSTKSIYLSFTENRLMIYPISSEIDNNDNRLKKIYQLDDLSGKNIIIIEKIDVTNR